MTVAGYLSSMLVITDESGRRKSKFIQQCPRMCRMAVLRKWAGRDEIGLDAAGRKTQRSGKGSHLERPGICEMDMHGFEGKSDISQETNKLAAD